MATTEDVINAIRNADASGDSAAVRQLGAVLQQMQQATQRQARIDKLKKDNPGEYDPNSQEWQDKYGATSNMSTTQKVLAGAGKAFTDVGRGVGQLLGINSQADIDEAKRLDAPLMKTTAGKVGNIGGNVAIALPTVFIPGAQGVAGSAAVGAGMGFIQPVASDESRLNNTLIGGAAGAGGVLAARGVVAGAKGAKALVEPFTEGGRQAIAGRTLQRFGVDAADVAGTSSAPTVTGAVPTLAEQVARPQAAQGAARLQDAMRAVDPEIAGQFAAREAQNNAARVGVLKDLAGEGGARDFAEAMRNGTAKDLYGKAFATKMDMSNLSAAERGEITKLMSMPAVKDAMVSAKEIAANQGLNLSKPQGSVEGLHLMKLAMDDAISNAGTSAASVNKAMSIKMARDRLTTFIEKMAPDYGEARATYAAMSKPLNQADVAAELLKKGTSATSDLAGNPRLMPDALARVARDEGKLITQATGRNLPQKTLADLMEPEQLTKLQAVLGESDRAAAVARAANGPGSATAQRLASQNVLRQILGPTGLPQSWAEGTLLNTLARPVQFAYNGVAEPKIQQTLAELLLNPAKAKAALLAARTAPQRLSPEIQAALPYLEQAMKASVPAAAISGQR
jgi:hypothetical protein